MFKTSEREILSLAFGRFSAHETIKYSSEDKYYTDGKTVKKYYSTALTKIVAKGANIAYDLICCVGMLRFIHHKQITDVWQTMILKYVSVPLGSISYISDKFLTYLMYVHEHSSEKIKEIISRNGCYVMHIDGTQEKGSEVLLEIKDEVSGITLISRIIPTENSEDIIPVLKLVKERFGIPLAIVRDNGPGIVKACNEVFPGVPQQSCHFHFLRDIGNALFKTIHSDIKKIFSKESIRPKLNKIKRQLSNEIKNIDNAEDIVKNLLKDPESVEFDIDSFHPLITYSIVRWILNYEKDGNGYGFPFDQSYRYLYERCQKAKDIIEDYIEVSANNETYYEPAMDAAALIQRLFDDSETSGELKKCYQEIIEICCLFDELRKILRIETTKVPMSDDLKWGDEELNKMKGDASRFKSELEKKASVMDKNSLLKKSIEKIISYLDNYWENLFVSNFTIITENGKIVIIISRTNNIMEHAFRNLRKILKMITGRSRLSKMIRCHGMGLSILFNLENEDYVNAIYGSLENIPLKFSEVDYDDFRKYQKEIQLIQKGNDRITFKDGDELKFIQNSLNKFEKLKPKSNGILL